MQRRESRFVSPFEMTSHPEPRHPSTFNDNRNEINLRRTSTLNDDRNQLKLNKNLFTNPPRDEASLFNVIRQRDMSKKSGEGDNVKNPMSVSINSVQDESNLNKMESSKLTKSMTYLVDKKKKHISHFAKLKKENDYRKFLERNAKQLDVKQMQKSIEDIQANFEKLSKDVTSKIEKDKFEPTLQAFESETIHDVQVKSPLSVRKISEGFVIVSILIIVVLILMSFIEGDKLFSNLFDQNRL